MFLLVVKKGECRMEGKNGKLGAKTSLGKSIHYKIYMDNKHESIIFTELFRDLHQGCMHFYAEERFNELKNFDWFKNTYFHQQEA